MTLEIYHCLYCEKEIVAETEIVFCNENCLEDYIHDDKEIEDIIAGKKDHFN